MEPIKRKGKSAGFHRLRRKFFEDQRSEDGRFKEGHDPVIKSDVSPEPAAEERKGRKPIPVKKYPHQTQDEWVAAERKRIFMEHMKFLGSRRKPK